MSCCNIGRDMAPRGCQVLVSAVAPEKYRLLNLSSSLLLFLGDIVGARKHDRLAWRRASRLPPPGCTGSLRLGSAGNCWQIMGITIINHQEEFRPEQ